MTNPEARIPLLSIKTLNRDGRGTVRYLFSQEYFYDFLSAHDVRNIAELPETELREMCHRAKDINLMQLMEDVEARRPGGVEVTHIIDGVEISSNELGFDITKRFSPEPVDSTFLDPTYRPVDLEILVIDKSGHHNAEGWVGRLVLSTTLIPPGLA